MSIKNIHVCDGCDRELKETKDIYHLVLKTDEYNDSIEMTRNIEQLEFCLICAREIKQALNRIAERLEDPMFVIAGDYIIRGVHGEVYPCKPDISTKTNELMDSDGGGK